MTRVVSPLSHASTIDLSLGDPVHAPPDDAIRAAVEAIRGGHSGYAPQGGDPQLRAAVAKKLLRRNGIGATSEDVTITTGASLGIYAALTVLCSPGDAVLVPDPGFPLYRLIAELQRLVLLAYPLGRLPTCEPDWDILDALAGRARVLLWNFPGNPTGAVAEHAWLRRLFDIVERHPDLVVVSDEVYEDLVYDGDHLSPAAYAGDMTGQVVSVFSFSKSYGMTGWRVGYVHAPSGMARAVARAHWGASMSTPTAAQQAAIAALGAPPRYLNDVVHHLALNRDAAAAAVRSAGLRCSTPKGGLFLWMDVSSTGMDSLTFVREAATRGVLLSPGTHYGSTNRHVRLSFAADSDQLEEGLARLGTWLSARGERDAM